VESPDEGGLGADSPTREVNTARYFTAQAKSDTTLYLVGSDKSSCVYFTGHAQLKKIALTQNIYFLINKNLYLLT
jgi:hypothetical protein